MTEEKISSVKAFVEKITKLRSDIPASNAEQWFFRGQKNARWDVRPSIFRGNNLALEHKIIEKAKQQNPMEFRDCINNLEILTKLQHYGLGTRLLDVTLNPLVALFFATEPSRSFEKNENKQYTLQRHDGRVYYRLANALSLNETQIKIALELPFLELGKTIISLKELYDNLKERNIISNGEYKRIVADDYKNAISYLRENNFIVSTNSNIRLIQQRGAFLVSPSINFKINTENIKVENLSLSKAKRDLSTEFKGSFIIAVKDKKRIREELDLFNVNEATLFPELEHQMHYIQDQEQVPVGTVEEYFEEDYSENTNNYISENRIPTEIKVSDVKEIIDELLTFADEKFRNNLVSSIFNLMVIDWQLKDSAISSIRREIVKCLSEILPTSDTKSKASEIVDKLLAK